jgi:hypothetical protein
MFNCVNSPRGWRRKLPPATNSVTHFFLIRFRPRLHYLPGEQSSMIRRHRDQPGSAQAEFRRAFLNMCFWTLFASGLAIEAIAPRLKIENHAFVMPPTLTRQSGQIRPDALVEHERWMQGLAATLTIGGAVALAFWHRRTLSNALLQRRTFNSQSR